MPLLTDRLFQIRSGSCREERATPQYHWDGRQRGDLPFVIVQCTASGEGVFEQGGVFYSVPAGHAFIAVVPEESRYFFPRTAREPWVFSWLNFYGEHSLHLWKELRDEAGPVIRLSGSTFRLFERIITRTRRKEWSDLYQSSEAAYGLYLRILRELPKPVGTEPLQEAVRYLRTHYQKGIRMKEVAAHVGMSREHMTRIFARDVKQTPANYLRQVRLEAAAHLLQTSTSPIAEIASRSGWSSPSKLDLFFKRQYGLSPRQFRQKKRI